MDVRIDAGSQSSTSSVKCKQEVIIKEEDADKPENSRINSGLSIHCEQSHIKSEDTICKNEEKLLSKSDGYDTFFIKEEEEECLQQETTSHEQRVKVEKLIKDEHGVDVGVEGDIDDGDNDDKDDDVDSTGVDSSEMNYEI
nr:uncharacterized protein LOC129266487 [Lytechinus pictus]